jgi:hypothetical protein
LLQVAAVAVVTEVAAVAVAATELEQLRVFPRECPFQLPLVQQVQRVPLIVEAVMVDFLLLAQLPLLVVAVVAITLLLLRFLEMVMQVVPVVVAV